MKMKITYEWLKLTEDGLKPQHYDGVYPEITIDNFNIRTEEEALARLEKFHAEFSAEFSSPGLWKANCPQKFVLVKVYRAGEFDD